MKTVFVFMADRSQPPQAAGIWTGNMNAGGSFRTLNNEEREGCGNADGKVEHAGGGVQR